MVHALEQIHRLLARNGYLIDIHPVRDTLYVEAHRHGQVIFVEQVPSTSAEAVQQAEDALAQVIRRRLFTTVQETTFDFRIYGDSVTELRDYIVEANAFAADNDLAEHWEQEYADAARRAQEAMRAAGPDARVAVYEQARITRLHPSPQ